MKFSIIVVCLNPGDKLKKTLDSINEQTFKDYEVVIKDGISSDGSLKILEDYKDININSIVKKDSGIYDAMNQALLEASGEYVYFLNCGDFFATENVLAEVSEYIENNTDKNNQYIVYGNIKDRKTGEVVASNPELNGFGLYRNVPCHQACFYDRELVLQHLFDTSIKVRADYEQFLWCYYIGEAKTMFMEVIVADYEGDGFSETKEHLKLSKKEHRDITSKYMKKSDIFKYKTILILTLAPLRAAMAQSKTFGKIYNRVKKKIYEGFVGN